MQKGFAHFVLIAVFVLAVLAAGTYFFVFKNQPSPNDKLVPPTPPNSEDLPWQSFKSEGPPFSFEYPQGWSLENVAFNGGYQGIILKGPEGEINMAWSSGFGGTCGEDLVPLQTKNETLKICDEKKSDGSEDFRLINKQISDSVGFSSRAHINNPASQNREVILKIFSTLVFNNVIDETANWKIYTNTKYGYEIKYPNNWTYEEHKEYDFTALYSSRLPKEKLENIQKEYPFFSDAKIVVDILPTPFALPGSPELYSLYLIKPTIMKVNNKEGVYFLKLCAPDCGIEFEYPYQNGTKTLHLLLNSPDKEYAELLNKEFGTNIQDIDQEIFKKVINTLKVLE